MLSGTGREARRWPTGVVQFFIANPFGYTKKLQVQKCSGHLSCPEEEINSHINTTYTDNMREQDHGRWVTVKSPPQPSMLFNINKSTQVIKNIFCPRPAQSALQGPQTELQTPWAPLRDLNGDMQWGRGKVPQQWRYAEGMWISKERNAGIIEQFGTITLLSVECKTLFKIVIIMGFLLKNVSQDP